MKKILLFFLPFISAQAQEVNNVRLFVEGDKVIVMYDIDNYSTKYLYNVSVTFQSTTKITPFALSGDVGKDIVAGKDRKLVWDIYQDIDGITGNLKAEVTAIKGTKLDHLGMASNAFLSMMAPGLGDYFVIENKWHPILVHAAFVGCISAAVLFDSQSEDNYNQYLSAKNQTDIDNYYSTYLHNRDMRDNMIYATAAVYVYDLAFVFINGKLNKKGHPYFGKKKTNQTSAMLLRPTPFNDGMQLSYLLNF
jgi:hypothetical protein